jgi:hypothetical protein
MSLHTKQPLSFNPVSFHGVCFVDGKIYSKIFTFLSEVLTFPKAGNTSARMVITVSDQADVASQRRGQGGDSTDTMVCIRDEAIQVEPWADYSGLNVRLDAKTSSC